jgi:hypothetical protein
MLPEGLGSEGNYWIISGRYKSDYNLFYYIYKGGFPELVNEKQEKVSDFKGLMKCMEEFGLEKGMLSSGFLLSDSSPSDGVWR